MMQSRGISFRSHSRLGFEPELAQVREQVPKNLKFIRRREAVELQHDRRIKRCHVAMPDVARHPGKKNIGVTPFESARYWQFGDGMPFPKIFAQEQRVDA